jgi:hypothetical protein
MFQQAPTQEREIDGSRVPCGRSAAVYAVDFTDNPAANEHGMLTAADLDFTAGDAGAPSGDITMLTNLASALETLLGERATNEQARSDLILAMGSAVGDDSFTFDTLHAEGAACPTMETLSSWAEVLGADVATLRAAAEADGCTYAAFEESSTPADGAGDTSDTPAEPDATPLSVPKPKRTSQAPNPAAILARERTRVASLTTIADQAGFDRAWINKHVAAGTPVDAARELAMTHLTNGGRLAPVTIGGGNDRNLTSLGPAVADAIMLRARGTRMLPKTDPHDSRMVALTADGKIEMRRPHDRAREFTGLTLFETARAWLSAVGVNVSGMSREQVAKMVFNRAAIARSANVAALAQSTSDFDLR